jgi:archaellum biogenesis ATPase FlaH
MKLFAVDVFTPNDFPEYTYVPRTGDDLEKRLADAIATPKVVVSLSGPSKSGKTVLNRKDSGQG